MHSSILEVKLYRSLKCIRSTLACLYYGVSYKPVSALGYQNRFSISSSFLTAHVSHVLFFLGVKKKSNGKAGVNDSITLTFVISLTYLIVVGWSSLYDMTSFELYKTNTHSH